MVAHGVSNFDVPPAPYPNVTPIAILYAARQPRLGKLATPQEAGVAVVVVAVLMAEEVGVEVAVEVADLEMEATLGELMIQLWCHILVTTPGTWVMGDSEPELGPLKQTSLAILNGLRGGFQLEITFSLCSTVLYWSPLGQQTH